MYRHIAAFAFVLLVSGVSSSIVPVAERDPSTGVSARDSNYRGPSSPVETKKLFECPPGWKFFCFNYENESPCECYKMITASQECPKNTNKFCSDYIKTECSCSYSKQPNCPPVFDFNCVASTSPGSTWTCTCAGKVWGKSGCPRGFSSTCYMGGCKCKKVTKYLSDYTPKPKDLTVSDTLAVVQIGDDQESVFVASDELKL